MSRLQELKQRAGSAYRMLRGRDGNLVSHAVNELMALGCYDGDEMNGAMADGLIELVRMFSTQGRSGFSASYAKHSLGLLLGFKPLGPLTGADDEWTEVGNGVFQNKRCSHVFKENGSAYDIDGIVWEEENGARFTGFDSRTPVNFPYTPTTVYRPASERVPA